MPKKLIEVALPLTQINEACVAEKKIKTGYPANIHMWWARRPLAATRAVLFAQLVDDPSSHPDRFPTEEMVVAERERLFEIIRGLIEPTGPSERVLRAAQAEIQRSVGLDITILDPFAGGGAIPLEAQRLGVNVAASDLNPVALLLNRVVLDQIRIAIDRPSVHPSDSLLGDADQGSGLAGLASDLVWYGRCLRDLAAERVGESYPDLTDPSGKPLPVIAWIWARTVACPNPACGIAAPLVRSWAISRKAGRERWVDPTTDGPGHEVNFVVREGKPVRTEGTIGRQGGRCIACGTAMPLSQIRELARSGKMGQRLMAVAALGDRRRIYASPDLSHEAAALVSHSDPFGTQLVDNARDIRPQLYGMTGHADLFTPRQLRTLVTMTELLPQIRSQVLSDSAGDEQYADLLVTLLAISISKLTDLSCSLTRWKVDAECPVGMFGRQAIPMVWDFAEGNPLGDSSGSFMTVVEYTARALKGPLVEYRRNGRIEVSQANAATRDLPENVVVSTDPPYFDNIAYADLADFYYVWLRIALRDVHPDLFATMLTPKVEELTALAHHHGDSQRDANIHFEDGFRNVFMRIQASHHPDIPMIVYYAYKQEDDEDSDLGVTGAGATGWEKMLQGMVDSGLQVAATWPMRTEMATRSVGRGANALASSVVLAVRPRMVGAGLTDRQGFVRHLRRELAEKLPELQSGGVQPVDMAQASIGPGMAVFTSYSKVLEGGDREMSVGTALQIINQVLDELQSEQESEFDADTRWAVTWFSQYGLNSAEFGDAQNIATARGTAMNALERSGILEARAGRVRLLNRSEYSDDWDPAKDSRLTVWEVCQHLIRRIEGNGGLMAAAELLRQVGGIGEAARDLAYRLYEISNRNGWSDEARSYNNLAAEWPDLVALAAQAPSDPSTLF